MASENEALRVERLLSRRDLRRLVPVSDMTIYRWEKADLFPRRLTINGRCFWRETEFEQWLTRGSDTRQQSAEQQR